MYFSFINNILYVYTKCESRNSANRIYTFYNTFITNIFHKGRLSTSLCIYLSRHSTYQIIYTNYRNFVI